MAEEIYSLHPNLLERDFYSNLGFDVMAREKGINVAKTKVGDGGEQEIEAKHR